MRELFEEKVATKHADSGCETLVAGLRATFAQIMGAQRTHQNVMRNEALSNSIETRMIGFKLTRPASGMTKRPGTLAQTPESWSVIVSVNEG